MSAKKKIGVLAVVAAVAFVWLAAGRSSASGFDGRVDQITGPYGFSMARWELTSVSRDFQKVLSGDYRIPPDPARVTEYLASVKKARDLRPLAASILTGDSQGEREAVNAQLETANGQTSAQAGHAELVLQRQIGSVLAAQGIFNPFYEYTGLKIGFPPVAFKLEYPTHLLVISPRDRIGTVKKVFLKQDLTVSEMDAIEQDVDRLGVASLVVELGGFAVTYPAFVTNRGDLRFIIEASVHEWTHQYLAFKPLGLRYILSLTGIHPDPEITAMNETVAEMVGREVGDMVYRQFYQGDQPAAARPPRGSSPAFDFNGEMRAIRRQVDAYLAAGQVDQAEQFMEQRRQFLTTQGYYIRKLNQAYFAFYGSYASGPGTISPTGGEFQKLRARSTSVGDFLNKAASITNHEQLMEMIR